MSSSDRPSGQGPESGSVDVRRLDSAISLLIPEGGLDGEHLERVLRQSIESLLAEGVTGFVVDVRSFPMLDSSGLGALVASHGAIADLGGVRLVLTGVGPSLHRALSRSMLLQVLPVYETVERAFAALRS